MKSVFAACLLVVLCGHSNAWGPSYQQPVVPFTPLELLNLADAIHRAANEKIFLKERLEMLRMQKLALFDRLDDVETKVFETMVNQNNHQDGRLENIKNRIKDALHRLGRLEATVASNLAISQRLLSSVETNDGLIDQLQTSNDQQNAKLTRIQTFLEQAKEKLDDKLGAATSDANNDISTVGNATMDFACLVNSKQCIVDAVQVFIDEETGVGNATVFIDIKNGSVPVVHCGLLTFNSTIGGVAHKKQFVGYGFIGFVDERQSLGLAIDCKAFSDRIEVRAFDHSRGKDNQHTSVVVQIKACTFAAQA